MAFLCPSRLGRRKQKKGYYSNMMVKSSPGDSLDALAKLELSRINAKNPESRRIILQNFTSCDPEELTVKQGLKVTFIFREGDWAYVATDEGKEGFVPFIYCAKLGPSPVVSAPATIKERFQFPQSAVIRPSNDTTASNVKSHMISKSNDTTASNVKSPMISPSNDTTASNVKSPMISKSNDTTASNVESPMISKSNDTTASNVKPPMISPSNDTTASNVKSPMINPSNNTTTSNAKSHTKPSNLTLSNLNIAAKETTSKQKTGSFYSNRVFIDTDSVSDFDIQTPSESVASTPRSDLDIVQAFFGSSSYDTLPKYLESFGDYATISDHIRPESPVAENGEVKDRMQETHETDAEAKPSLDNADIAAFEVCRVQYNYEGSGPDDISAEAGDRVCVMDGSDMFWYLVQKEDRSEGYIPKYYLQKIDSENTSPRSNTFSTSSYSENIPSPHDSSNSTPTNMDDSLDYTTDDPVVVPCNTQFMKITIADKTDSEFKQPSGKITPVKPPRTNKPKSVKPPVEVIEPFHEERGFESDDDDDSIVVELEPDDSDSSQGSLSESMRIQLIHKELEKLAPLQQRDSMHNSMSSYDDSVFDNDAHRQLDQLRPTSAPPYKVYKYQREKAEYYDEYFFEEPEPRMKNADKEEVINVAEILEIRDALRRVKEDDRMAKLRPRTHQRLSSSARLKQYMLPLPLAMAGYGGAKNVLKTAKDSKGTRRYYVSQVEENEEMLYSRPVKVKHKQDAGKDVTTANEKNINIKNDNTKGESPKKNDNCEKGTTTLKKRDWSFGYPRKTKINNDDVTQELNDLNKPDKEEIRNVSEAGGSFREDDMDKLLEQTGGLLDQSKQLLTKKHRYRTANPPQHTETPERNIEFTSAEEKCNHYLTNLILHGTNIKHVPSETSNEHTEDENVSNVDAEETSNKNKPRVDENENIKLSHDICNVDEHSGNAQSNVCEDIRGITEFVVQYDYTPTEETTIPVVRGEVLHIGLDHQEDSEWYWAYSPRLRSHGYVPKLYVRIPMVTII